ncbi:MAG: hypothetical protein AAF355_14630 [Myxococcota bacterium]
MNRSIGLAFVSLSLAAWSGCSDGLSSGSDLEGTRVLGARTRIEGDPQRAWPAHGESVEVEFLVLGPELTPYEWVVGVCPRAETGFGIDICSDSGLFAINQGSVSSPDDLPPSIAFEVPSAEALENAETLLLSGTICIEGSVSLESDTLCQGAGVEARAFSFVLTVWDEAVEPANRHPILGAITLDGQPWIQDVEDKSVREGCAGSDLPQLEASLDEGPKTDYVLTLADGDYEEPNGAVGSREPFVNIENDMVLEELQVSHIATLPDIERQFTFIDDDTNPLEVEWTAPRSSEIAPEGSVVRVVFVMRDLRDGMDWATRAACVIRTP